MTNPYDQTPYPSLTYVHTHPDRMATLAILLGMDPAPVERCRVLDVGCAGGGNLLPMAFSLPNSEFVGIDYSLRQIEEGRSHFASLGLRNLDLRAMDILEVSEDLGQFDYIIAHGVYSWTPAAVRDRLLDICQRNLAPNGVAYVSYNTYPGWHIMGIVREAMLYATRDLTDNRARVHAAKTVVKFLADSAVEPGGAYAAVYRGYLEKMERDLKGSHDSFLLHDELEEVNHPVYFHEFVEHALAHGLQYLAEAELATVMVHNFPSEVADRLARMAQDAIELEQYMDFVRNRMFRQTLLCRADAAMTRVLRPETMQRLMVASQAKPVAPSIDVHAPTVEQFRGPDGAILSIDHGVTKAALLHLGSIWPLAIPFQELLVAGRARLGLPKEAGGDPQGWARDALLLANNLLRAYAYSSQLLALHAHRPSMRRDVSERPLASPVARFQAQNTDLVTNLWHDRVQLDATKRALLPWLDGNRSHAELAGLLATWREDRRRTLVDEDSHVVSGDESDDKANGLDGHLRWLARTALLVG